MRPLRRIILHCSYTPPDMDIGVEDIRRWHVDYNKWRDIGYHYVVRRDGTVETGRPIAQAGAHVAGHNHDSIGICMVGGMRREGKLARPDCNYTAAQWAGLEDIVGNLIEWHPSIKDILGHRDLAPRECPCFDARAWESGFL